MEMRRRGNDFRRPGRRRFLSLFWFLLSGFAILVFIILLRHDGLPVSTPILVKVAGRRQGKVTEGVNTTEEMVSPYSTVRQMTDQLALAKGLVAIAKENNNLEFAWELSAQIRVSQSLLSETGSGRAPLGATPESEAAVRDMAVLLVRGRQSFHYDTAAAMARLKATVHSLEDQLNSANAKSSRHAQIAAEQVPKGLHCLGLRLTLDWSAAAGQVERGSVLGGGDDDDGRLLHFCVFSDNVLATSVVVNSTAVNSRRPERVVFHLVTDGVNHPAMAAWFSTNSFRGAKVRVEKMEDMGWLNETYVPVLRQLRSAETRRYYFSGKGGGGGMKFRNPKYLSMLNHLRFYIPEVYPALKKVVFLDDDVVVQRDLSELFRLDLGGNVNGAVETCMETFHRYHKYLNFSHPLVRSHFDPDACGWAFGMNVFDLAEWRRRNATATYHYWQQKNVDRTLWKLGTLPPGLLTFYGMTRALDPDWHVLGLGYTEVPPEVIQRGAVIHFNGNAKPWLKIGLDKYRHLWDKYVDYSHPLLQQCNVG